VILSDGSGRLSLREGLDIVISYQAEPGEWIGARSIQAALGLHGCTVPIQPQRRCSRTAGSIVLAVRGRDETIFPTAVRPEVGISESTEAYTLRVDEDGIVLWGASPAGLARGAQTLLQALAQAEDSLPAFRVEDAPAFPWRGILLDVSRGKVPRLETLYRNVEMLSSCKMNILQLYVEDTFAFRGHPLIGRAWGALTPEEIVALDAYCRDRYVELMPCLQSFGHLRRILELPAYRHLAETDALWSLTPVREESYDLLSDLYADYLACFSSPYLNVCCDETFGLGTGQSKEVADRDGRGRLFLGHLRRLHALAAAHGRTLLVWDDMFLHYPELLAELPRDTVLLNWWYSAQERYPQVDVIHAAGLKQVVCPGTSSWNTPFPRLTNARANIRNMAAEGQRVGALGVLTTDWGDNGHPNLLGGSWYGYAYGASESWSPGSMDDQKFEAAFGRLFFGSQEAEPALAAMRALSEACLLPGLAVPNGSRALSMFFGDPLTVPPMEFTADQIGFLVEMLRLHGMDVSPERFSQASQPIPPETLARMHEMATSVLDSLSRLHGASAEVRLTLEEMRMAARQIAHVATKARVGSAVAAPPEGETSADLAAEVTLLKRDLHELRAEYERLWLARDKPQGLWLTLDKFDTAAAVLDRWTTKVQPGLGWGQ